MYKFVHNIKSEAPRTLPFKTKTFSIYDYTLFSNSLGKWSRFKQITCQKVLKLYSHKDKI